MTAFCVTCQDEREKSFKLYLSPHSPAEMHVYQAWSLEVAGETQRTHSRSALQPVRMSRRQAQKCDQPSRRVLRPAHPFAPERSEP